jgi:hypothetical protein
MSGKRVFAFLMLAFLFTDGLCFAQQPDAKDNNVTAYQKKDIEGGTFSYRTITGEEVKEKDFKLGPGMEVITIRGVNVVAPIGTRVEDKGSWIKVEDLGELLGRKFDGIEARLKDAENKQKELSEELGQVKNKLSELEQRSDKGGQTDE